MTKIPRREDYSEPIDILGLICTNVGCYYVGTNVRKLDRSLTKNYDSKYKWLCPKCFEKLILRRMEKEKVDFT